MQGRSLKNGAITQEITDPSKVYRLLGSEKYEYKLFLLKFINYILSF
jgi:hypothetical protein